MKLTVLSSAAFLVAASAFAQDNTQGFGPKLGAEEITPPSGQATIGARFQGLPDQGRRSERQEIRSVFAERPVGLRL